MSDSFPVGIVSLEELGSDGTEGAEGGSNIHSSRTSLDSVGFEGGRGGSFSDSTALVFKSRLAAVGISVARG